MRSPQSLALLLVVAVAGCGPIAVKSVRLPVDPRVADAVAIYPIQLAFPHDVVEKHARTADLVRAFRTHAQGVALIGPEEFRVLSPAAPPKQGSTLGRDAPALGFSPERVVVLRAVATRQEHTHRKTVTDFHGNPAGAIEAWYAVYRVTLELVAYDGTVLARTSGEAWERPEDLSAAGERHPKLKEALPLFVKDLHATAEPVARLARRPARSDLEVAGTHRRLFAQAEVAATLPSAGTIERDVAELAIYGRLGTPMSARWLEAVRSAGDGVVVTRASGSAWAAGVRPGDVIVAAGGQKIVGEASFGRAVAGREARLLVARKGERFAICLSPPDRAGDGAGPATTDGRCDDGREGARARTLIARGERDAHDRSPSGGMVGR